MAKKISLSKTSQTKISKFIKKVSEYLTKPVEEFTDEFNSIILNEVKIQKECTEKNIVDYYIESTFKMVEEEPIIDENFWDQVKKSVRGKLSAKYCGNKTYDNNIDIYFNEVKKQYIEHPVSEQDELEFLPENRDIFIKNNLKLVIECAKRYRNLGLPFEDLIQAGNLGLLVAFDKFDKDRANLRISIIKSIKAHQSEMFTYEEAESIIKQNFSYSKNLDQTVNKIPKTGFESKEDFINWVKTNVKKAIFASVAFQWIRAYIIIELDKTANIIRVPKSKKEETVVPNIIRLDSINPHTDDCYHDNQISEIANEEFLIEDESIEIEERNQTFKQIINSIIYKLNALDCRILKKRFGIDLPYQLSISEIAENEGISDNKVKYSLQQSMKMIKENIKGADAKVIEELL